MRKPATIKASKSVRRSRAKGAAPAPLPPCPLPITPSLDLSYLRAATIMPREFARLDIVLVGCGGTGSYMAMHIGRMMRVLQDSGKQVSATFVDPDTVEEKNLGRQFFCNAELGMPKALTLASRYGSAWGLDIAVVVDRFSPQLNIVKRNHQTDLTLIIGCVDNAAGRKAIASTLKTNRPGDTPHQWYLDCGNHEESGQVLLGSAPDVKSCAVAFRASTLCCTLPSPVLQRPELLQARPEELDDSKLSCAELLAANLQSLNINARVAAEAADMMTRLLVTRNLKRFACEIDLAAGAVRSTYATPENVARIIGKEASFVFPGK